MQQVPLTPVLHTTLVTGGTGVTRQAYIRDSLSAVGVASYDRLEISPDNLTIGIDRIRQVTQDLTRAPYGRTKALIIWNAHTMTTQSQNALLKSLEEPPPHAVIFLETDSEAQLLPTIISRAYVIHLGSAAAFSEKEGAAWLAAWKTLATKRPGERLAWVEGGITTRDEALSWVTRGIWALQKKLHEDTRQSRKATAVIRRLLEARVWLTANVNPKLAVDDVLLAEVVL